MANPVLKYYKSLRLIEKLYCYLRIRIAPFDELLSFIPAKSQVIDLGCGFGLLSNLIASSGSHVLGVDKDTERIAKAKESVGKRTNISFQILDLRREKIPHAKFDVIVCVDLLHHLPRKVQERTIRQSQRILTNKGIFILKEIDTKPRWKYLWNLTHDLLFNGRDSLCFRSHEEWVSVITESGFKVNHIFSSNKGIFYPHVIFVAQKK